MDLSRYDTCREGGALKTTTNPAYGLVGVSSGTDSPVTADKLYEIPSPPSHHHIPATPLPAVSPTGGDVGVVRE